MILRDTEEYIELEALGKQILVRIKKSVRARNISIRINAKGQAELVLPRWGSVSKAKSFLLEKSPWLVKRMFEVEKHIHMDKATIPIFGVMHSITQIESEKRSVELVEGNIIKIYGPHELRDITLVRYLRDLLLKKLEEIAENQSAVVGLRYKTIHLIKGISHWGSCAPDGTLSFNWRLALAPMNVVEYLVAHELAHIKERNHGVRFWHLVDQIYPDNKISRKWLKTEGRALHRILEEHR